MNKLLKILLVFIIFFTVAFKAEAYQIAVWDAFDSAGSSALKLKISGSKMQNINKYNLSLLNPKIYPVIIFTNYRNMDNTIFNSIAAYLNKGGKIVVVLPESSAEETSYIQLAKMLGVRVEKIIPLTNSIDVNWVEKTVANNSLSTGARIAKVALPNASHLAVFGDIERHESAISLNSKGVVLSWRWSRDGSAFFNEKSMQYVLQELLPKNASGDMSSTTIVANSDDAVGKIHRIREYVEKYQNNPMNYPKDISTAQQNVELSKINEFLASYYAKNSNPKEYSKYIKLSNDAAVCGLVGTDDSSPAENRGIWFDRGTIVSIKSRSEMAKYFEKLKKSGINTVYFETVNAGYTIYPSKIGTQNPMTKGRDVLAWAVDEAHSRKIKLHAWMWVFAVGNDRHNKIINKPNTYAGPVLEKNMRWAMLGENGNMRPKNQPEFWIDPSNRQAVNYLLSLADEIVKNYDVDGVQLDYIRYPFQSSDNLMGFNHNSMEEFTIKTGEKLTDNYQYNLMWNRWKEANINSFVKKVSAKLKSRKSDLKISVSIFSKSPANRLNSIQQNWENWIDYSYIDSMTPMSYSSSLSALSTNLAPLKTHVGACPIYPGIALQHVDEVDLMQQIAKIREEGFPGVSFFALAQFQSDKTSLLQNGFFSQNIWDPVYDTKKAALLLLEDYMQSFNIVLKTNNELSPNQKNSVSSIIKTTSEVISYVNYGKLQYALTSIKQLENQNAAFFRNCPQSNSLKKQTATSYLTRAENLIKISNRKK